MSRGAVRAAWCLAFVAPPARAAFERPPVFPEGAALGAALAVSGDPVFGNPAGAAVSGSDGVRLEVAASRPFGIPGLEEAQASVSRSGLGLGLRRFGSAQYREGEIRLVGARVIAPGLSAGAALRGLSVAGDFPPYRSAAVDCAVLVHPEPGTELGAVLEAVLGEIPGDPRRRGARTALGLSREVAYDLRLHVELHHREGRPVSSGVGLAWSPSRALVLRGGVRDRPRILSWGLSVRLAGLSVSGSATLQGPLGRTLRVGLSREGPAPPSRRRKGSKAPRAPPILRRERAPGARRRASGRFCMDSDWLDADETATSLQITKATLYKLVRDGRVPAEKVAGRWRFERDAIEDLFAAVESGVGSGDRPS